MVQVTVETTGRLLVGSEIGAALTALEALRPDVIGLNCATGPAEMTEHLRYLAQHSRTFLSCLPNAGLPSIVDGHTHYDLTPDALAEAHERFVDEFGLNIVGGCCGTTPAHLRAVVERIGTRAPVARTPEHEPSCSSIYSPVTFHQELAYLAVGERTNANGSRKFRDAMLEADWDTCVQMAREQVKEGAHVLDVCVDYVGRDGAADMHEIASRFATQAALPLVFDSTEPQVLEAGLQHSGGKAILNSANLEEGEAPGKRFDRVMSLAREYGAAVICLAIDEEGQARTADRKLAGLQAHLRPRHRALRHRAHRPHLRHAHVPARLGRRGPPPRRHRDHRGHPARQDRAARVVDHPRPVEHQLRAEARDPPRAQQRVPARVPRGRASTPPSSHAARIMPMHKIDDHAREVTLDLIYDRRRDGYDPLTELMALFEGVDADRRSSRKTARTGRSSNGSSTASSTATATASRPTSTSSSRRGPRCRSSTTCCSRA